MKLFYRLIICILLVSTTVANCAYYGSLARIPIAGDLLISHTAGKIQSLTNIYISGGRLLPETNLAQTLARKATKKAVQDITGLPQGRSQISYGQAYDLFSVAMRILYWLPPFFLGILALTFFRISLRSSRKPAKKKSRRK